MKSGKIQGDYYVLTPLYHYYFRFRCLRPLTFYLFYSQITFDEIEEDWSAQIIIKSKKNSKTIVSSIN